MMLYHFVSSDYNMLTVSSAKDVRTPPYQKKKKTVLGIMLKCIQRCDSCSGYLVNVEYSLIAIKQMIIIHHHHHVVPPARISLTLSHHSSLSFIASGRSSGLHFISSLSCCMYVRAGCPAFAWPYGGVHRRTSLMSSSLLLHQCPACLVHLTLIVFVMGGRWPYSWYFVGCCLQDLFKIARSILV